MESDKVQVYKNKEKQRIMLDNNQIVYSDLMYKYPVGSCATEEDLLKAGFKKAEKEE